MVAQALRSPGCTGHCSRAPPGRPPAAGARWRRGGCPSPPVPRAGPRFRACRRSRRRTSWPSSASRSRGGSPKSAPRNGSRTTSGEAARVNSSSSTDSSAASPMRRRGARKLEQQVQGRSRQTAHRPRRQLPDRRDQGRAQRQQRADRGQLRSQAPALSLSRRPWRGHGCRRRPKRRADFAHDLGRHHAVPGRPRPQGRGRGGRQAGGDPLDQFAPGRPRKAAAAGPSLAGRDEQILERQDQHAPERQRPGRAQQRQPVADRLQQPIHRATPVERVDQADDLQQLLVAGLDMSRSRPGNSTLAVMPLLPGAARPGAAIHHRQAPVRQSSCSLTRRPRSKRISGLGDDAGTVRSSGSSIGSEAWISCSVSRCAARSSRATDSHWPQTWPQPSSSHSGGSGWCAAVRRHAACQRAEQIHHRSSRPRAAAAPRPLPHRPGGSAEHGRGVGGGRLGLAGRPLPTAT